MIKDFLDVSSETRSFGFIIDSIRQYNNNIKNHVNARVIIDLFNKWDSIFYDSHSNVFLSILSFIQMRQVILVKFQNFYSELGNNYNDLLEKRIQLDLYKNEIINLLLQSKHVEEDVIDKFEDEYNQFNEISKDIDSYLLDLQIGLQNEFYKKMFRVKIPIRKQEDSNIKILTPKKSKATSLNLLE